MKEYGMSEPTDWPLLARYLSGESSKKEKEKIEFWIAFDPENQKLVKQMKIMWEIPETETKSSDVKKLWHDLAVKTGIETKSEQTPRTIKWPFNFEKRVYQLLRYAAVLLVTISIAYFFSKALPWGKQPLDLIDITVENGDRQKIELSDGSTVLLDAGSNLRYPKKFKDDKRDIYLNGEGYFEVVHSKVKPFIVHSNDAIIKVLGTKFNVRAWQKSQSVQVVVSEGKVSLQSEEIEDQEPVIITKGQMSVLAEEGQPTKPHNVNIDKYLGWMHNEVTFENIPLKEVLHQLERWYKVRFELVDPALAEEELTIHLQDNTIDEILDLIATLSELDYERDGDTIQLEHKKLN
jgi:transmembrane sensor